jgi:DNA-binding LacI/PurR family transcriptional regulator/DNA-binding transcriptional regulator YhcF (GntR family)
MSDTQGKKFRYIQIYENLVENISTGAYPIGTLIPSEKNLGKIYDVERTTIRKALKLLVKDGMLIKIQGVGTKVIRTTSLNHPQNIFQNNDIVLFFLATTPEKTDRLTQPFYSSMFFHLENDLKKRGYKTIYSTISENDNIKDILSKYDFAGIIFASYGVAAKHLEYVDKNEIPYVTINNDYEKAVFIASDNYDGGYLMGKHLISLGHRKIALLKGTESDNSCKKRLAGLTMALAGEDITIDQKYVRSANWVAEQGYIQMKDIIEKNKKDLPTAVFAFNDATALGAIRAIHEIGLRIPEDISISGFDNIDQSEYASPPITTIDCNVQNISKIAVTILHDKVKGLELKGIKILIPVNLIVRGSTGPVNL